MKTQLVRGTVLLLLTGLFVATLWAQTPTGRRNRGNNNAPPQVKLPDDPRLLELHRALVRDAEKLAVQYQKSKDLDKARVVYEEILRFVPAYQSANMALQKIHSSEASAQRNIIEVAANKGWQDTGLDIVEGRPVVFRVFEGKWHLMMDYKGIGPDGIEIPKELRQFNLGALIGYIAAPGTKPGDRPEPPPSADSNGTEDTTGRANAAPAEGDPTNKDATPGGDASTEEKKPDPKGPFYVGTKLDLIAPVSGRLFLRMYDAQPDDNTGKLNVTVNGTFGPPPSYPAPVKSEAPSP